MANVRAESRVKKCGTGFSPWKLLRPRVNGEGMPVREFKESDLDALKHIHTNQNFPYEFPDLNDPLFVTKLVLTDEENNKVTAAVLLRLTAEAYLLLDPHSGTPTQRWQSLLTLHATAEREAWQRGLQDIHAWLPPSIAKTFGRRLQRLGWVRDDTWSPYCKRLQPILEK